MHADLASPICDKILVSVLEPCENRGYRFATELKKGLLITNSILCRHATQEGERGSVLREKTNQGSEETGGEQHKKRLLKKLLQFKVLGCISDKTIYLTLLHQACLAES